MSTEDDRRAYDPFAPAPATGASEEWVGAPTAEPGNSDPVPDNGMEDLTKDDLIDMAKNRYLPTYGTKADIVKRIQDDRKR